MELRPPDIYRQDTFGSGLEHAIGEPPGARANIKAGTAAKIDPERLQRGLHLEATTAHEALTFQQHEIGKLIEQRCRLHQDGRSRANLAGHNHPLGAFACLYQATLNEKEIGSDACHWHRLRAVPLSRRPARPETGPTLASHSGFTCRGAGVAYW